MTKHLDMYVIKLNNTHEHICDHFSKFPFLESKTRSSTSKRTIKNDIKIIISQSLLSSTSEVIASCEFLFFSLYIFVFLVLYIRSLFFCVNILP